MDFQSIKLNRKSAAELEDVAFDQTGSQDIAIVGIALKLPLADTVEQFAHHLKTGHDSVRPIPSLRKQDTDMYFKQIGLDPDRITYGEAAYLDEIDKFDYAFFKLSPREASLLDPNQRLFLETAWRAIEDAGYGGGKLEGSRTGVYVGYGSDADYLKLIRQMEPDAVNMSMTGNVRPIIASRLSYLMDLRGPSFLIDCTCSSSLVAVHLACQAIRNGECDGAIVGGIQLHLIPVREYEVGIESSTSRARTFDDLADGTGTGEGVVAMMLKPLDQAIEARDHIYAVIKSSATNQDGGSVGITAPNAEAQEAVIVDAWKRAAIDPESIDYIETHGTGTKLGDPIEVEGLQRAFRRYTDKRQFCAIGAIKSNIGHLDNTAGIAGLLKAVLSLKNKCIYPTLHFDRPNRVINFAESPVYVSDKLMEWERGSHPRRCGVSSFGISGTNCHVVVEEAPEERIWNKQSHDEYRLFVLSAQSESALEAYVDDSIVYLTNHLSIDLGDLCYTLSTGRGHYRYRIAIAATSVAEVVDELRSYKKATFNGFLDRSVGKLHHNGSMDSVSEYEDIHIAVEAVFASLQSSGRKDRSLCDELSKLYVRGANIPWERLYRQERRRRISYLTYPFDRYRCWVKLTEDVSNHRNHLNSTELVLTDEGSSNRNDNHNTFYHQRTWNKVSMPPISRKNRSSETMLLLREPHQDGISFVHRWEAAGTKVIVAVTSDHYERVDKTTSMIRDEIEDYERLLSDTFASLGDSSLHIVDLRSTSVRREVETLEQHEQLMDQSVYRLYRLVHALAQRDGHESVALTIVTAYADEVIAEQAIARPEQFAMIGLSKAIGWENPNLRLRWIDVDEQSDLVESVCSEIEGESNEYWTAYRAGNRYVERVDRLQLDEATVSNPARSMVSELGDNKGAVLITGGLGDIGLLIATHLVKETKGNIVLALMGRTGLPPREHWHELDGIDHNVQLEQLDQSDQDMKNKRAIIAIREMESAGARIEIIEADVSNKEQLEKAVTLLRQRHGRIVGIVHAAGVSAGNLMSRLSAKDLREVIASKTTGTWLLDHVTRQDKLDFLVLFSSAITLVGGIGSGPYTAGNAYLDGYSAYRNRLGLRTLTINWPAWKQQDEDVEVETELSKEMFFPMSRVDGLRAFQELLVAARATPIRQAIVGEWNRNSHLFALREQLPFRQSEQVEQALMMSKLSNKIHAKEAHTYSEGTVHVTRTTSKSWPRTHSEIEVLVTAAWKRVLGYEELDVHANFFEVGGDSILITRVHQYINEKFPELTTVADMFSYPTITRITDHLYSIVSIQEEAADSTLDLIEVDSFDEAMYRMFDRMKSGELSIEKAVDLYRGLEVTHG